MLMHYLYGHLLSEKRQKAADNLHQINAFIYISAAASPSYKVEVFHVKFI